MEKLNPEWITKGINDDSIQWANKAAETGVNGGLNTTQLRKFYGELKRLQLNHKNDAKIYLLQAKLAYAAGREKKVLPFYDAVKDAMNHITKDYEHFNRFALIMEAFVAYHKFYEESKKIKNYGIGIN